MSASSPAAGVPEVVAVKSDSGMMGGKISHEFMLLTDVGEDTIVTLPRVRLSRQHGSGRLRGGQRTRSAKRR